MSPLHLTPLTKDERVTEITGMVIGTYHGNTHLVSPQFERPIIMENAIPQQPGRIFKIIVFLPNYTPGGLRLNKENSSEWMIPKDEKEFGVETLFLPYRKEHRKGELVVKAVFKEKWDNERKNRIFENPFIPWHRIRMLEGSRRWTQKRYYEENLMVVELQAGQDGFELIQARRVGCGTMAKYDVKAAKFWEDTRFKPLENNFPCY